MITEVSAKRRRYLQTLASLPSQPHVRAKPCMARRLAHIEGQKGLHIQIYGGGSKLLTTVSHTIDRPWKGGIVESKANAHLYKEEGSCMASKSMPVIVDP